MSEGYFFIALGKRYIDECWILSNTIRKQDDNRPISLLIHREDEQYAKDKLMFDQLVFFEPSDQLWNDCQTSFEKYCLYPRIYLDEYLPYTHNITVDSDVLCQYNPDSVWNFVTTHERPIIQLGRADDPNWHWGHINEVSRVYGKHVPHVHGGFFYTRKDPFLKEYFDYCKHVFYKYEEYGAKRFFRGGKVDEIIFAIAHSHFNFNPVDFDDHPIMTFNYGPEINIPSKLQTESNKFKELDDYIPFVHMFDKMEGTNFFELYKKIMQ
jgi:hypothetical protein